MHKFTDTVLDAIEKRMISGMFKALKENDEFTGFAEILISGTMYRNLIPSTRGETVAYGIYAFDVASFNETYPEMLDEVEAFAHHAVVNYLKNN